MAWIRTLACVAAALFVTNVAASAQTPPPAWPQRLVKFILPLGAGSGVDITARLLGDKLSQKWGQSVVVDNRPGGDGVVAISAFTTAHDTHTLLMSPTSAFTHHPWAMDKMPYDPADLVPIVRITNTIVAIVVPASSTINSLAELDKAVLANPGKFNQANITGFFDMVFHGFQKQHHWQIESVPYRNPVQASNDLAEGRIQLLMAAMAIVQPLVQAGKLKMIAVTASKRPSIANLPTTAEAGFPDLTIDGLVGLFGPRELPAATRERIAADVRTVLADPTVAARLASTGQVVNPGTPKEFEASMDVQRKQAAQAAKILGLKKAE